MPVALGTAGTAAVVALLVAVLWWRGFPCWDEGEKRWKCPRWDGG